MMIIKIGGGSAINLQGIVEDLAQIDGPKIIVHGANALRDELAQKLGMAPRVITSASGYASVYSDANALDVMMMAYAGLRNKRLVELFQRQQINAIGLTGLDGLLIRGRRNRGIRVKENGKIKLLRDFSGKPQTVNKTLLILLLEQGYLPVITVPIADENGFAINSENDDIVALLQSALQATTIVQLIEAPGFLENPTDPDSVISRLTIRELRVREQQSAGRIKRKLHALVKIFESGKPRVIIADGRVEHPVKNALNEKGTVIQ
ncbi:acetylglutamate kinase [Caldithrix abyssi DSM 13497]|uniref:Acetylglutamate kinase n=1 Tax=Caldithrix abyssi DSM 13497 TaxID=880073 RepID=H1XQA7_CALAY|nr:[LysW]-aminoadipate kinase [Caldithrix abyssi]APF19899.1 acetylglutamate/LysW-gamma-L-alpha-aminoadipate kinase [Caldithrix abyssi DSM 13497]EHO39994.1 acetylglutamate kinase [Caldithrix abyssi DSM 13497]